MHTRSLETTRSRATVALKPHRHAAAPSSSLAALFASLSDAKICSWVVGVAAVLYIGLFNPFWVPSGDGDLYVAIARSIVLGEGFRFNGQFVNICPPGWPLVLAAVAKVSPTFAAFKLVTIVSMLVSLATWYYVLRRITSRAGAAGVVLLTAFLVHVYSLTFWTHSEAIFCMVSTFSILLALQIAEGRPVAWRLPVLLALCAACVLIRWAGILQFFVIAAILFTGRRWWRLESLPQWGMAMLVVGVTMATFFIVRQMLALSEEQEIAQREVGAVFEDIAAQPRPSGTADGRKLDLVNMPTSQDSSVLGELKRRAAESGTWFSWLFWQPFRFAAAVPAVAWAGIAVGWVVIAALGAKLFDAILRCQWMWLGLAAYCAVLCINWPNANARYLVPITPLLMIGAIQGVKLLMIGSFAGGKWDFRLLMAFAVAAVIALFVESLLPLLRMQTSQWIQSIMIDAGRSLWMPLLTLTALFALRRWARSGPSGRPARVSHVLVGTFVATIALVNLTLYAIDVRVARSSDFYNRYEAGFNDQLIRACYQLNQLGVTDAQLAVAERYANLGKVRKSKYAVRAAVLLTGRAVQTVRDKMAGQPKPPLLRWCQTRRVDYYLDQRPSVPWRLWHFVLPRSLNERLIHGQLGPDSGGWALYQINITPVPVLPLPQPANLAQRLVGSARAIDWPSTQPATQPATEYRRSAERIELPQIKNWPTRVPGL